MNFSVFLLLISFLFIPTSQIESSDKEFDYDVFSSIIEIDNINGNHITPYYQNLALVSQETLNTVVFYIKEYAQREKYFHHFEKFYFLSEEQKKKEKYCHIQTIQNFLKGNIKQAQQNVMNKITHTTYTEYDDKKKEIYLHFLSIPKNWSSDPLIEMLKSNQEKDNNQIKKKYNICFNENPTLDDVQCFKKIVGKYNIESIIFKNEATEDHIPLISKIIWLLPNCLIILHKTSENFKENYKDLLQYSNRIYGFRYDVVNKALWNTKTTEVLQPLFYTPKHKKNSKIYLRMKKHNNLHHHILGKGSNNFNNTFFAYKLIDQSYIEEKKILKYCINNSQKHNDDYTFCIMMKLLHYAIKRNNNLIIGKINNTIIDKGLLILISEQFERFLHFRGIMKMIGSDLPEVLKNFLHHNCVKEFPVVNLFTLLEHYFRLIGSKHTIMEECLSEFIDLYTDKINYNWFLYRDKHETSKDGQAHVNFRNPIGINFELDLKYQDIFNNKLNNNKKLNILFKQIYDYIRLNLPIQKKSRDPKPGHLLSKKEPLLICLEKYFLHSDNLSKDLSPTTKTIEIDIKETKKSNKLNYSKPEYQDTKINLFWSRGYLCKSLILLIIIVIARILYNKKIITFNSHALQSKF